MEIKEDNLRMLMKVLAIDIGYHNMGLVLAECGNGPKIKVEYLKKISLEDYKYIKTNDVVDLVPLFVEDHKEIFDEADTILIERQPPGGFTNIEVLLNYMFRDKVVLVSPVSMHTHFGMRHLNYEERKVRTVNLTEKYTEIDIPYERKHDIADAVCMLLYYNFKKSVHFFDQFKFKSSSSSSFVPSEFLEN
jgi:hypothetical protein